MEVFWLGSSCFRIRGREATILVNPCPPSTGYKIGKVAADIVAITNDQPENNYRQAVTGKAKYVTGPGEFEIAGVLMSGVRTHSAKSANGRNIAFVFDIDDIRVCHLGNLEEAPARDDVEALSAADVLLVPIGASS